MAIKKTNVTKRQAEKARSAIEAGQIIKKLQDHLLHGKEMTPSQIRAGLGLLSHYLPSVQDIHNYDETPQTNPEEMYNNVAEFLRTDEVAREELRSRGLSIRLIKPELKVVG